MNKNTIEQICSSYSSVELNPYSSSYRKRIKLIADACIDEYEGNFLEIGAGEGYTTLDLLKISTQYNKKTIVIDPFEDNWENIPTSYGRPYPYATFMNTVKEFSFGLILYKESSHTQDLCHKLQKEEFVCFAYVDGLQYKNSVKQDLELMRCIGVPVIGIDDMYRQTNISEVPLAIDEFLKEYDDYALVYISGMRECYLIKDAK